MGLDRTTEPDPSLAALSITELRTDADVLRLQYDTCCRHALTLHDDWRSVTAHAASLWKRRQATLAEILRRDTLASIRANRAALATERKTG